MDQNEIVAKIAESLGGVCDFSGEMMLLDWSKSTAKDGPKVKFMLADDEAIAPFEVATIRKGKQAGQLYHVFAIRIDEAKAAMPTIMIEPKVTVDGDGRPAFGEIVMPTEQKRPANELARRMMIDGYFRNPALWRAMDEAGIYTAEMHKQAVRYMKCIGPKHAPHIECDGDVCGHHARSASLPAGGPKSSNPMKVPHWYCVPVCHAHHMQWVHGSSSKGATREDHAKLTEVAVGITADCMKARAKGVMGIEYLRDINADMLLDFEERIGLTRGSYYFGRS